MQLHGQNIIGDAQEGGGARYRAVDAATGRELEPDFFEASDVQVDRAATLAAEAFGTYRNLEPAARARFLREIGSQIEAAGDELIDRANSETALGVERLRSERGRTVNQLRMFAELIEEGSWIAARIDRAIPDRKPVGKPDVRRMLIPLGPVAVFGASNFPLAFSVVGGDTASAFAAGCPVIVKAHPAHPGTSEMAARAIGAAIGAAGMPPGIFSMLHGRSPDLSLALVRHPLIAAVGFTGSLHAGRAIFDAAMRRPRPIPVYAEMGSVNPLFVLPGAAAERGEQIAQGLKQSVTLGVGQFCTKPGVVVGIDDAAMRRFAATISQLMQAAAPASMLHAGIHAGYRAGVKQIAATQGVRMVTADAPPETKAIPALFLSDGATFLGNPRLAEENFGPSTVLVSAESHEQLLEVARAIDGHLTATIHGTESDLRQFADLVDLLRQRVGRLIFNGFPTGVEVCPSMQHGGPYPATTDSRTTSVGTAAIERFVRPVCYQNFPQGALPPELRDENPRNIWRMVDGQWTRNSIRG